MNTILIVLELAILGFLVWKLWKPILAPPKREVPVNNARLYFFYTEWCGFSQKAQPEWKKVEEQVSKTPYFGRTKVTLVPIDAEKDRKTAELYEVNAYPTFKLETHDGLYEYTKSATATNLIGFLRETLGKETESL